MDRCNQNNVIDSIEQEEMMLRYLLGQSPEDERVQVEERFFSDGAYFDELLALEDSLIDDFVSGRMSPERLDSFRQLQSIRQEDIRFSRALSQAATQKKLNQTNRWDDHYLGLSQWLSVPRLSRSLLAGTMALLVLLAMSVALLLRNGTLQNRLSERESQVTKLREEKETAEQEMSKAVSQSEASARELENERNKRIDAESILQRLGKRDSPSRSTDVLTIALGGAFISRGGTGAIHEVHVSESVHSVQFEIPVGAYGAYASYGVSIKLAGQSEIFSNASLKPSGLRKLIVTIPAADFHFGDYILTLYGEGLSAPATELEQYSFRISR